MANPKHLEILGEGVEKWNRWRSKNNIIPDLSNAELRARKLSGAYLLGAYLVGADLANADLRGANLRRAELVEANLRDSDLSGADLSEANLGLAKLIRTDLREANLQSAFLGLANLYEANLAGADLLEVAMTGTMFINIDLREVKNLDTVEHYSPSSIGIDTIYKSQGSIPEKFLRGCGLPESFITYIPALVAAIEPIQLHSCFISYSSKDGEFVERLYNDLQKKGVRCFYAPEHLKIGDKFRVGIDEAIRRHDKLLLVLSENSVSSQWVEKEVETAFEKEEEQKNTVLFPVRLDDAVLETKTGWAADIHRTRHIGDFTDWKNHDSYRKAFERLIRDLKTEAQR